jgi:hypothetical protein
LHFRLENQPSMTKSPYYFTIPTHIVLELYENGSLIMYLLFGAELLVCHAIPMPSSSFGTIDTTSVYFDAARKNAKAFLHENVKLAENSLKHISGSANESSLIRLDMTLARGAMEKATKSIRNRLSQSLVRYAESSISKRACLLRYSGNSGD